MSDKPIIPRAFISYSWTSAEHGEWVIQLGNRLRENGVDVTLDKWDLKEGHDAVKFMEQMVTAPDIQKVIVVLDRGYAEKADSRKGGVGTETQIISAEVYKKTDQTKFVAVIAEKDADGQPFLPTFYKSRIYIDLSDDDTYAVNFDQLLRWVYDKPLHVKPSLGKRPQFLSDNAVTLATATRARRAIEQIRNGARSASAALDEYLTTFAEEIEKFRIHKDTDRLFDDLVLENIAGFLPYRDEYLSVIGALARFWPGHDGAEHLQRFFEKCALYLFRPQNVNSWSDDDFDNFKFIVQELFLYTITVLLRHDRFDAVNYMLDASYYLGDAADNRSQPLEHFGLFRGHLKSLVRRNERLKLNRTSFHADLLEQSSKTSGIPFKALMQTDFILFLRSSFAVFNQTANYPWWPETLVYAERLGGPFEIFARAQSRAYFEKIKSLIGVSTKEQLVELIQNIGQERHNLYNPRWNYHRLESSRLIGLTEIASRP